jgi:hypothetical protein
MSERGPFTVTQDHQGQSTAREDNRHSNFVALLPLDRVVVNQPVPCVVGGQNAMDMPMPPFSAFGSNLAGVNLTAASIFFPAGNLSITAVPIMGTSAMGTPMWEAIFNVVPPANVQLFLLLTGTDASGTAVAVTIPFVVNAAAAMVTGWAPPPVLM